MIQTMEKELLHFLSELNKFEKVLPRHNKWGIEFDEVIFLLAHTWHIKGLTDFVQWWFWKWFIHGIAKLICKYFDFYKKTDTYFLSSLRWNDPRDIAIRYDNKLRLKWYKEKIDTKLQVSQLGRNILNELDIKVNWSWKQKMEVFLQEHPSLLALWIAILWSIVSICIAIFDKWEQSITVLLY